MRRARTFSVPLGAALILSVLLLGVSVLSGRVARTAPVEQPIAFNHIVHANDYDLDCQYCHLYADRSPVAGVPPVKTCMGCHDLVAVDKPEIEELTRYWEEEQPIEWIKIYDLPDFVRFTHKRHVRADVECSECHGAVETMEQVQKVSDLSMGWCLDCHLEREADFDCLVCHY